MNYEFTDKNNRAKKELILEAYRREIKTPRDFLIIKNEISEKFKVDSIPNYGLADIYKKLIEDGQIKKNRNLETLLKKAKMRTLSGVAVVSVLTKPYPCPGKCLYCPSEKGMPKSYLSNEPAVMRAILCIFDPYRQVQMRLKALKQAGHATDKIELIIMGGSFSALPEKYQYWFVKECYRACNSKNFQFSPPRQAKRGEAIFNFQSIFNYKNVKNKLFREQKQNEKAGDRVIGITLETRPDLISEREIKKFREMGCTKVEIGVQSIYDEVLEKNKRGHGREEIIKATKLLKNAGFKVSYHMMPNLLGSNLEKDYKMFAEIFSNPDFQPDLLKIYPCVVTKDSELYDIWKEGGYKSYSDDELFELLVKIKKIIPPYVRISRLIRDIPEESIESGNKKTNLRQIIANHSQLEGWKCKCIRCREIRDNKMQNVKSKMQNFGMPSAFLNIIGKIGGLKINKIEYPASGGKEIFLEVIDNDYQLYAMLRLRIFNVEDADLPVRQAGPRPLRGLQNTAIIREVHTYGESLNIGDVSIDASQHKGLGKKLIEEAEKIVHAEFNRGAKEDFGIYPVKSSKAGAEQFNKVNKISVIAGVGAREYYRKLGYKLEGTYMVKKL